MFISQQLPPRTAVADVEVQLRAMPQLLLLPVPVRRVAEAEEAVEAVAEVVQVRLRQPRVRQMLPQLLLNRARQITTRQAIPAWRSLPGSMNQLRLLLQDCLGE